jgi:serine/threonine-protein kinase
VKLADFGLARVYQNSPLSGLTLAGQFGGTVAFMAPEQITHFRDAQPSVDQYAIGATLYYLLTGRRVYDFPTEVEQQLLMILQSDPLPIRTRRKEIPARLADVIHRALARKPANRFADVEALRQDLLPFASGP